MQSPALPPTAVAAHSVQSDLKQLCLLVADLLDREQPQPQSPAFSMAPGHCPAADGEQRQDSIGE